MSTDRFLIILITVLLAANINLYPDTLKLRDFVVTRTGRVSMEEIAGYTGKDDLGDMGFNVNRDEVTVIPAPIVRYAIEKRSEKPVVILGKETIILPVQYEKLRNVIRRIVVETEKKIESRGINEILSFRLNYVKKDLAGYTITGIHVLKLNDSGDQWIAYINCRTGDGRDTLEKVTYFVQSLDPRLSGMLEDKGRGKRWQNLRHNPSESPRSGNVHVVIKHGGISINAEGFIIDSRNNGIRDISDVRVRLEATGKILSGIMIGDREVLIELP